MLNIEGINSNFKRFGENVIRFRVMVLLLFLLILGVSLLGLRLIRSDTNQDSYFLEGDSLLAAKQYFASIFGNDDFCAILVESNDVFTLDALTLIRQMGQELKAEVPYADDVLSLTEMEYTSGAASGISVNRLVPDPVPEDPASLLQIRDKAMSKPSIRNRMVSDDGRQTWIMLRLKPLPPHATMPDGESVDMVIGRKVNEIAGRPQYVPLSPRTTGLPVINLEKRLYMAKETPKLLGISLVLMVGTLAFFLRTARGVIFPLLSAVCSIVIIFGLQGFLGIEHDPAMIFLPVFLGMAMAICYSIYVVNFYRNEFLHTGLRKDSLVEAIGETAWPIGFSALTTIAGLLSFCLVPLRPIRWMGFTAAALTALIYVLTITLLPALISFGTDRPAKHAAPRHPDFIDRLMTYLGHTVLSRPRLSLSLCTLAILVSIVGLMHIEVSFDIRKSFGSHIPYVERICTIAASKVGSLYSYGIGIELPSADDAKDPENLRKLDMLCQEISQYPLTAKVSSILDILKDINQVVQNGTPSAYAIPQTREEVAQLLLLYENAGGIEAERWVDYDYRRLRILVEMADYNSREAAYELVQILQRGEELFPGASIILTGSLSQFTVMQEYISWGQIQSILISLVVISLLMAFVFGSIKIGLIGMIPNIVPSLFTGALMGFMDFPLDLLTVTVMPMLLGLAVDDTIHFISHCQLEFSRTGSYAQSIQHTFRMAGKAMFLTTLVLSLCFSAYMISDVAVFMRLGILIILGACSALLADYFITPVLLSRLRVFGPERQIRQSGT